MGRILRNTIIPVITVVLLVLLSFPYQAVSSQWKSSGTWQEQAAAGFGAGSANMLAMPIVQFQDKLYTGVANEGGAQVWVKDAGAGTWTKQMEGGFGSSGNLAIVSMEVYDGYLYAGTANLSGCGLWRFDGTTWTDALALTGAGGAGFGDKYNLAATAMQVYDGKLYVGLTNYVTDKITSFQLYSEGVKIWRYDGSSWTEVDNGAFTDATNAGVGSFAVYDGYLYACTIRFDVGISLHSFSPLQVQVEIKGKGCQLWRSDGAAPTYNWTLMADNGFTDTKNLTSLAMSVFNGKLLIGTANGTVSAIYDVSSQEIDSYTYSTDGLYIYEYSGSGSPSELVKNGFGSNADLAAVCMEQVTLDATQCLLVGTASASGQGKLEVFDGTTWSAGATAGLGNTNNKGIVSLAVAEESGSDVVYAGTLNPSDGCEIWRGTLSTPPDTHAITVTQGAHGSITPTGTAGVVTVDDGADRAFTITPDANYHVADVLVDGGSEGAVSSYTFSGVTADHAISATFAIDAYAVNASVSGGHGTVTEATQTINHGASATIHINPDAGYHIDSITDNGAPATIASPYVISNVTAAHTVVVTFTASAAATSSTWYLAEGSTNWGFDCYISIENPNETAVHVKLTYMTGTGPVTGPTVNMPAKSQATVYPSSTLGAADFSTKVECLEGKLISVDRTMYWTGAGAACPEAHCATGVTSPATTWYMPEGSSAWGFECFLLIANPNDTAANCTVTWMIEGQAPVESSQTVGANSRQTLNMADFIGQKDASIKVVSNIPVIPERAMYRNNRREGHDSTGTAQAASDYYLAEGCAGFGFTTYVLVQNPQGTPTDVTITYQAATGPVTGPSFQMPANSRKTICVNDTTTIPGADPSFSTKVHGSQPIIAERAMYWNGGPDNAQVCHDSIGLDRPYTNWYLADGQSSEGRETWTLIQNPNSAPVTVEVTYMTPNGAGNVTKTETIAAGSRKSFNMAEHSGISGRAAIMVVSKTAGSKVMVERAMYWNSRGTGTDTIGGYSD